MRTYIFFISTLLTAGGVLGQDVSGRQKHVEYSIGLSGVYSSFQDTKFSNVRQNGFGGEFYLGHTRENDSRKLFFGFNFMYSNEKPSTFGQNAISNGETKVFYPTVHFTYLHKLNENFFVGGRIDALDFYLRKTSGLGNNSSYYNNGVNLYGSLQYQYPINENMRLSANLDLGLYSMMRESTGFAYSAPQSVTSSGSFNQQDKAIVNLFGFKYAEHLAIWQYLNAKIGVNLHVMNRWTFHYRWNVRRFSTVRNYPTTYGIHSLGVTFDMVDKIKTKKK